MIDTKTCKLDTPNFMNDALFKVIMTTPQTREFAVDILHALTGIKKEYLENATYIGGEEINKRHLEEKRQATDVTVTINDEQKIIVEMNQQDTDTLFDKNALYVMSRIVENTKGGKEIQYQKYILINIDNFNSFETKRPILTFLVRDEEGHIEHNLYTSIHLILENCEENTYNIPKEVKKFARLISKKKKIEELESEYEGDAPYMAVVKKVKELSMDPEFLGYYDVEEKHKEEIKDAEATGVRKGIEQGIQEGEHNKAISTATKLLQMGLGTPKEIMEATGLSLEEVNRLKEEM